MKSNDYLINLIILIKYNHFLKIKKFFKCIIIK